MSIKLENVSKTYFHKGNQIEALKPVDLNIQTGEIFGLIGFSGAGKSTLLRMMNLLELPTSGRVSIGDVVLTDLDKKSLRIKRQKIGMIFQQFNLIESKTVYENIEFVLKAGKYDKSRIQARIGELLDLVGLSDKQDQRPSSLSGGQKQRVGIARALANDPEVLLCDEATSALDPETTKSILKLIKDINRQLGITIVLITHEMEVIKEIADTVGVMSNGDIVEINDVYHIFSHPGHEVTRGFVQDIYDFVVPEHIKSSENQRLVTLKFLNENAEENYLNQLYRYFDLNISILNGRIEYIKEEPLGIIMLSVSGEETEFNRMVSYIDEISGIERADIYG